MYLIPDASSSNEAVHLQQRLRSLSTELVTLRNRLHVQGQPNGVPINQNPAPPTAIQAIPTNPTTPLSTNNTHNQPATGAPPTFPRNQPHPLPQIISNGPPASGGTYSVKWYLTDLQLNIYKFIRQSGLVY